MAGEIARHRLDQPGVEDELADPNMLAHGVFSRLIKHDNRGLLTDSDETLSEGLTSAFSS
jgi:hypothetical protein